MGQATSSGVKLWVALLLLTSLLASSAAAQAGGAANDNASLVFTRAKKLRHGINANGWFAQIYQFYDDVHKLGGYTPEQFDNYITDADLDLIVQMGFDHVRLGVNPQPKFDKGEPDKDKTPLFDEHEPNKIPKAYFDCLDKAVAKILTHKLAVIIELHPDPGSDFKARMKNEDEFVEKVADFWQALAAHYSDQGKWDHESVFFEIMNEPEFPDGYRWMGVQTKLAAAIRRGAPSNTIIAAGANWSNDDDLVFQEPIRDPNVIYNFHFYEPKIFTHQGANFSTYYYHWLQGVRYPSTPESATAAAAQIPDTDRNDRLLVIRYGNDHWDATRIEAEMKQAKDWANANGHGVPLICNEFGVYRDADAQDRAKWLQDVTPHSRTTESAGHCGTTPPRPSAWSRRMLTGKRWRMRAC